MKKITYNTGKNNIYYTNPVSTGTSSTADYETVNATNIEIDDQDKLP